MTAADAAVTYSRPTATLTVTEGSATATLTFSEKMTGGTAPVLGADGGSGVDCFDAEETDPIPGTGMHTAAGFKLNNAVMDSVLTGFADGAEVGCAIHNTDEVLTTLNATGTVLSIVFSAVLATGDVVTIGGGTNFATAVGARQLSAMSATVVNDISKPTVTGKIARGQQTGIITFSEALTGFSNVTADIDCVDGGSNAVPTSTTQIAGTLSWQVVCAGTEDIELATDYIHIKTAGFTDLGGNAMLADVKIYAVTDAVAPTVTSVTLTKTTHAQCTVTPNSGDGDIKHTAKKGAAAQGGIGNAWSFQLLDSNAAPAITLWDALNRKVVFGADVNASATTQPTANTITNMLNADSRYNALFTATVATVGTSTAAVTGTCVGGTTTYNATVQHSEGVINAAGMTAGNYVADASGNGVVDADITEATVAAGSNSATGKVLITMVTNTAAELLVAGTSMLHVAVAVTDISGNAPAAIQKIVMQ
jgi:hypothetical protein